MTRTITQKARVLARLTRYGFVTNLWAWQNGIWRLADIIMDLRRAGHAIETEFNTSRTGRNCRYNLTR